MTNQQPEFFIQCDWDAALRENDGQSWVSLKIKGQPGIHGYIRRHDSTVSSTEGFKVIEFKSNYITISHELVPSPMAFLSPRKTVSGVHSKSVSSVSVNHSGLTVSASADQLVVWESSTENVKLNLKGHVGDVYKCRYFPSGEVIITCGSDMKLNIWCAKKGLLAVTLKGHLMAVTDVDFIDRGRNVISVSKDGTLKLWNCGDSSCLATVYTHNGIINCCKVMEAPQFLDVGPPPSVKSDKEVNSEGKIVLLGCEDGHLHCVSLHNRTKLFSNFLDSAINCISTISPTLFVVGCQNGQVHLFDLSCYNKPIKTYIGPESPICSLLPVPPNGFFMARSDGSILFMKTEDMVPFVSLTGSDHDPVYDLATDNAGSVYTCSRDATIRIYSPFRLIKQLQK